MEQLLTVVGSIVGSILVVVAGWYLTEKSKRKWEAYKRKEDNYRELIRTLNGFYEDQADSALRQEFLYQLNICWLYGSDEVIRSAYSFLDTVHTSIQAAPGAVRDGLQSHSQSRD